MRHEDRPPPLPNPLVSPKDLHRIRGSASFAAPLPLLFWVSVISGDPIKEYSKLIRDEIASAERPEVI